MPLSACGFAFADTTWQTRSRKQFQISRMKTSAVLACVFSVAMLTAGNDPPARDGYGYRFLYKAKVTPKEYLQKHPCVSGVWRCKEETDTHFVGVLSYPTGNVPPAFPEKDEPAFQVQPVKIAKMKGLPINLKTWTGPVILLQADARVRFATKESLESTFKLVGYEAAKSKGEGFLFKKHGELEYKNPN